MGSQAEGRTLEASTSSIGPHDHICLIYDSPEDQQRAMGAFIRYGLERRERCLYVADSSTYGGVGDWLRRAGVDVEAAAARGALVIATERQAYLASGQFDPDAMLAMAQGAAHQAVQEGYTTLRIAGEMTWALGDAVGAVRIIEYEAKVNERLPTTPALALCQYDRRRFPPEVIRDVIRTHPLVVVGGRVCRNFYYVPPGELMGQDRLQRDVDRLLDNIQARERAEEALRDTGRRLALAERLASVGTLAAGVAHEINNPLSFVAGNLAWIAERLDADSLEDLRAARHEVRAAIAETIDGAARIRDIVQGLRRFSRPSEEGPRVAADVEAELDAALAITRHQVAARARITRDVQAGLPRVAMRQHELGQVLVNLLVNAAQALPEGRAAENEVKISARTVDAAVEIEVSDTGSGMPPEIASRVFDPFFTTKPPQSGAGLGLAICLGIVTDARGSIRVDSAPGRGTTFRVTLPAMAAAGPVPAEGPRAPRAGRRRVLVIDDEPHLRRLVVRVLSGEHDVEALASAGEALARLEAGERWDLILCDLVMPDVTGMEFSERLVSLAPDARPSVVYMTGGAHTDASRAFIAGGGHRILEKPFLPEALRALVSGSPG